MHKIVIIVFICLCLGGCANDDIRRKQDIQDYNLDRLKNRVNYLEEVQELNSKFIFGLLQKVEKIEIKLEKKGEKK